MATVSITYFGVAYQVRAGATVMRALEEAGIAFRRGASCRQGICGACVLVCRVPNEPGLRGALACQTRVVDGMDLMPVPRTPSQKRDYDPAAERPIERLLATYPELEHCNDCGACNAICPVGVDIHGVVRALPRWDLSHVVGSTSACVSCGLCSLRCPVNIPAGAVAMQARRAIGRALAMSTSPPSVATPAERDEESRELDTLSAMSLETLKTEAERLRGQILVRLRQRGREQTGTDSR